MATKKKELKKAQSMAAEGASIKDIKKATDLSRQVANRVVTNKAPSSSPASSQSGPGGVIGTAVSGAEQAVSAAAAQSPSLSKQNTVSQNLKIAQDGGITKKEFAAIAKGAGKGDVKLIQRMDAMNKNGQDIRLNSGAANMLIKGATKASSKNPASAYGLQMNPYGTGNIGRALAGMIGNPGIPGAMIKGQKVGGREATPGTGMMIGGTQIRKGGRVAVKGFGNGKGKGKGGDNFAPELDPVDTFNDPVQPMDTPMDPLPPEEPQAPPGPGMMASTGEGIGGATKLNRAKSRLRQLGIYGRGTGLLGRGLQYGNALNR